MADEYAPFGIPPAFDPMTGAQIGGDLGRTEPEAYPNKFARALIQVISNMPKHSLVDAPSALVDSARRAPLPGADRTPENEAATQDLAGQSFMTALGLAGQSMPFAPHASAGIFGGRLAKTADQAALRTAEEMHAGGADRSAIWDKTGWFQGSDGKWRFEIPDDKAQMNPNVYAAGIPPGRWGKIAGEVWHKDLYDAYPDLRNATGMIESRTPGSSAGGSYSAPGVARSGEETIHVQSPTVDEARSVSLHELQHAVQEREGFASGGNPSMFKQGDDAIISRDALSYRRELEGLDPHLTPKQKDEIVRQRYRAAGIEEMIPPQAARDVAHDVEGNPERTLRRVMELYGTDKRVEPHSPRDLYRQVPGEIEARNVQARRDMTPDQRRANPPWSTADAPGSPILNEMFGKRVGLLEGGAPSNSPAMSIPFKGRAFKAMDNDVPNMSDAGLTHVALDRKVAEQFSNGGKRAVRDVDVTANKPFDFRDPEDMGWLLAEMRKPANVKRFNQDTKKIMGEGYDFHHDARNIASGLEEGLYQAYEVPAVIDLLKSKGYDGIYMQEEFRSHNSTPNLALFAPTQIKVRR